MITDILRGERCPNCGADAIGAESRRLGELNQYAACEHLAWWRLQVWLIECGVCRFIFPIVAQAEQVDADVVVEASRR